MSGMQWPELKLPVPTMSNSFGKILSNAAKSSGQFCQQRAKGSQPGRDLSACNAGITAVGQRDGDGRLLIVREVLGLDLANF